MPYYLPSQNEQAKSIEEKGTIPQAGLGAGKVPPMRLGSPGKNNAVFQQPSPAFAFPSLANQLLGVFFLTPNERGRAAENFLGVL